jgi:hypothetical protein
VLCNGTKNVDNETSVSSTAFIKNANKKRLIRNGLEYAIAYNEQIIDIINRGNAKKFPKKEMEEDKGPVQYIPQGYCTVHCVDSLSCLSPDFIIFSSLSSLKL